MSEAIELTAYGIMGMAFVGWVAYSVYKSGEGE